MDKLKDKPCADCGNSFPPIAMDFDHREENEKTGTISSLVYNRSMEEILEETKKCDVVCACCHRIRTYARGQYTGI